MPTVFDEVAKSALNAATGKPGAVVTVDDSMLVEYREVEWDGMVATLKYNRWVDEDGAVASRWHLTLWGGGAAPGVEAEKLLAVLLSSMAQGAPCWRVAHDFIKFVSEYTYFLTDTARLDVVLLTRDDGESGALVSKVRVIS